MRCPGLASQGKPSNATGGPAWRDASFTVKDVKAFKLRFRAESGAHFEHGWIGDVGVDDVSYHYDYAAVAGVVSASGDNGASRFSVYPYSKGGEEVFLVTETAYVDASGKEVGMCNRLL